MKSLTAAGRGFRNLLVREPLLHFVLLGIAIFAASQYFEVRSRLTSITVTQGQMRHLVDTYRMQYGSTLSPQQLKSLVDNLIKSETSIVRH